MKCTTEMKISYLANLIRNEIESGYDYHTMMYRIRQYANMNTKQLIDTHHAIMDGSLQFSEIDHPVQTLKDGFIVGLVYGLAHVQRKSMSDLYHLNDRELIFMTQIINFIHHHRLEMGGKVLSSVLYGLNRARYHQIPPSELHLRSIYDMAVRLALFENGDYSEITHKVHAGS